MGKRYKDKDGGIYFVQVVNNFAANKRGVLEVFQQYSCSCLATDGWVVPVMINPPPNAMCYGETQSALDTYAQERDLEVVE